MDPKNAVPFQIPGRLSPVLLAQNQPSVMYAFSPRAQSRSTHATQHERFALLRVVQKHMEALEARDTDSCNSKRRNELWEDITLQFNAKCTTSRNKAQVQTLYKNMKAKAKKYQERLRSSLPESIEKDEVSETLLMMLGEEQRKRSVKTGQEYKNAITHSYVFAAVNALQNAQLQQCSLSSNPAAQSVGQFVLNESSQCDGSNVKNSPDQKLGTTPTLKNEKENLQDAANNFNNISETDQEEEKNVQYHSARNKSISPTISPSRQAEDVEIEADIDVDADSTADSNDCLNSNEFESDDTKPNGGDGSVSNENPSQHCSVLNSSGHLFENCDVSNELPTSKRQRVHETDDGEFRHILHQNQLINRLGMNTAFPFMPYMVPSTVPLSAPIDAGQQESNSVEYKSYLKALTALTLSQNEYYKKLSACLELTISEMKNGKR